MALISKDLSMEAYREYTLNGTVIAHFDNPKKVLFRKEGKFHRVVDADGAVTIVPRPTCGNGVLLKWKNKPGMPSVVRARRRSA